DGKLLAVARENRAIHVRNAATGALVRELHCPGGTWAISLAFSADNRLLAAGLDGTAPQVRLWDVSDGKDLPRPCGHTGPVSGVCFLADNQTIVSASVDGTIRILSPRVGEEPGVL